MMNVVGQQYVNRHNYHHFQSYRNISARTAIIAILFSIAVNFALLLLMNQLQQPRGIYPRRYAIEPVDITRVQPKQAVVIEMPIPSFRVPLPRIQSPRRRPQVADLRDIPNSIANLPVSIPLIVTPIPPPVYVIEPPRPEVSAPAGVESSGNDPSRSVKSVDAGPVPISCPDPVYPNSAKSLELQGWVDITFIIEKNGKPVNINIIDSTSTRFHQATIAAVHRWLFEPAMKDGKPVPYLCRQRIEYILRE